MASADQGTPEEVVLELTPLNGPSKAKNTKATNTKATNAPSRQTGTTPQQAFAGAVALKVKAQQLKRRADKLQVQKVQRPDDHLTTMRSLKKKMNPTKSYSPWVEGIDGIAPNHLRLDVLMWCFLVHFMYPIGPLYVYLVNGKQAFINFGFGLTRSTILTSHTMFLLPVVVLVWALVDSSVMRIYGIEILVLWFSHVSRLLTVAVKYAHCDEHFLHDYFHSTDQVRLKTIGQNLMLPSGWFSPKFEQWMEVIDRAEHSANASMSLHGLSRGHGLMQHMRFLGEAHCQTIEALVAPYEIRKEMKDRHFTSDAGQEVVTDGLGNEKSIPTRDVSVGLILTALCNSPDVQPSRGKGFALMALQSTLLSIVFTCVGIFYRMLALKQPGGGDHAASGFFTTTIVLVTWFNFWAFFNFTEVAVVDYKRRAALGNKLVEMIRPVLKRVGEEFKVMPKLLDITQHRNAMSYLVLRQVMRSMGKQYRLRLQWVISYSLALFVIFFLSVFTLVFSSDKSLGQMHLYAMVFCGVVVLQLLRSILAANQANAIPSIELKYIRLQSMEALGSTLSHLEHRDLVDKMHHVFDINQIEMSKNKITFINTMMDFIKQDDNEHPIRIVGVRADFNLLRGFIISVVGATLTFIELAGIDVFGSGD
jgi:hypothetical protein